MVLNKMAYLIIDVGTGNLRVAVVSPQGQVLGLAREDIQYHADPAYENALYFDPETLWKQIIALTRQARLQCGNIPISALIASSQREGIVLLNRQGDAMIGLPNIDHRGRPWESMLTDKMHVYRITGRYPGSLFSAFKLVGLREKHEDMIESMSTFLSISDWVEYKLSGVVKYEHSQASETLLYDVAAQCWSQELCNIFKIDPSVLAPLMPSGTLMGPLLKATAYELGIDNEAVVLAGGGDTQLAIRSTRPSVDDVVIVSGTTTPIVKLVDSYLLDEEARTWTSRDIVPARFVFEANAGVTGLNYQRLKEIFYPNEGYDIIEQELSHNQQPLCMASLGSIIADEKKPLLKGGFLFPAPVTQDLTRSSFVWATLVDIACSIAENYFILAAVSPHQPDYIWACGGGLQSKHLRQLIANITNKKIQVRKGFEQASAVGGAIICNQALGVSFDEADNIDIVVPQQQEAYTQLRKEWKRTRSWFMHAV